MKICITPHILGGSEHLKPLLGVIAVTPALRKLKRENLQCHYNAVQPDPVSKVQKQKPHLEHFLVYRILLFQCLITSCGCQVTSWNSCTHSSSYISTFVRPDERSSPNLWPSPQQPPFFSLCFYEFNAMFQLESTWERGHAIFVIHLAQQPQLRPHCGK